MNKIILVAAFLMSLNALADDVKPVDNTASMPRESYASGLLGAAIGTSSGGTNSFIFAGRVGTSLFGNENGRFSLGAVAAHDSTSTSVGTVTANGSATLIMAELITRGAFGTGLYFGARIGVDLSSITVSSGATSYSASATPFAFGPTLGYEFPIVPNLAFDFDFSWISVSGASYNFPGLTTVQTNSAAAATLMGGLTYHW